MRRPPGEGDRAWAAGRCAPSREYGNIFDHFAVEYEYPNGVRVLSMCRQIDGAADNVSERVVGTKGICDTDSTDGYDQRARSRATATKASRRTRTCRSTPT